VGFLILISIFQEKIERQKPSHPKELSIIAFGYNDTLRERERERERVKTAKN
jgi:hypothetical protein